MSLWCWMVAALLILPPRNPDRTPTISVSVDSSRHEVVVASGPFNLPNMPPMEHEALMDLGMSHDTRLQRFEWPVEGWVRGFRVELEDGRGRIVPPHVIHHLIMVNFSRRQLLYSAAERLMGAGSETEGVTLPKTIGIPMKPAMKLGVYVAWHNDTGEDLEGVRLKLVLLWTPKNQNPPPVNAMPIYMDVNLTVGGTNTFDVPPGKSTKSYEFTLPVGGRLLGVGGHMHDYGVRVRLEEAASGKVLTQVTAQLDSAGKLIKVSRKLFGVTGQGLRLKANRRYRLMAEYDNPTGRMLPKGAMAHMVGLFVPEDMKRWPAIDPRDPTYRRDLASLDVRGAAAGSMQDQGGERHEGHGEHQ